MHLPEGRYRIVSGGFRQEAEFLPGAIYSLELRSDSAVSFTVQQSIARHVATVRAAIRGAGRHRIEVRGDGVDFGEVGKTVELTPGTETVVEFTGRLMPGEPWVGVVAVDGDWLDGKEVRGE